MNADVLVDLLLELNIINVKDVDSEIAKLASRLTDPRAQKWFKRVPRFFLINIDRLLKEPYVVRAEPRGQRSSKYYADPNGGWKTGSQPEQPGAPLPVRETYDKENQTYTTSLHEPAVQRDIEQSFTSFKPAKAKAKRIFGEPPTKTELQPWMKGPEAKEKEFHHFDPIQTRRRELFGRLGQLVSYLNYQSSLIGKQSDEATEKANATEAEALMRKLETMKTDDIQGFRDVLKDAGNFIQDVKDRPWFFTKDGQTIAKSGDLVMRKVIFPETAVAFSKRTDAAGDSPIWCTKSQSTASSYLSQGPLYFIDKDDKPFILVHLPTHQVKDIGNMNVSGNVVSAIAPLFADPRRFEVEELRDSSSALYSAVSRIRNQSQ